GDDWLDRADRSPYRPPAGRAWQCAPVACRRLSGRCVSSFCRWRRAQSVPRGSTHRYRHGNPGHSCVPVRSTSRAEGMGMSPPGLSARNIGFSYRGRLVLSDASLSLSAGELVCLLGVNGAGKSTLLKIMLGLLAPDTGVVALDGAPFSGWRRRDVARRVAYVPQAHMASFPYTVMQV